MNDYRTAITDLQLQDVPFGPTGAKILCDISTGQARPVVPKVFRKRVFESVHNLSHPSIRATQQLIVSKFVWHGIRKDSGLWAKQCVDCQASKVQTHVRAPPQVFEVPPRRFDHINIDIVGPLPVSQGCSYLLTMVDRFTRWPEAVPLRDVKTETCARALLYHWVARFGLPSEMSSDRGVQFVSELWLSLSNMLGIQLHRTTAYHPQANGLVEQFHRHMKSALKVRLSGPNWMDELPWVLLGIRTAPKADLRTSSAELVYGSPLTVPGDFIAPSSQPSTPETFLPRLQDKIARLAPVPTSKHGLQRTSVPKDLKNTAYVFIRCGGAKAPLQRPYEGPFRVLEWGDKTFKVQRGNKAETVSVDRLKPAHLDLDQPVLVAQPRRRGRPPANKNNATHGIPATQAQRDSDILIRL